MREINQINNLLPNISKELDDYFSKNKENINIFDMCKGNYLGLNEEKNSLQFEREIFNSDDSKIGRLLIDIPIKNIVNGSIVINGKDDWIGKK